MKRMHQTDLYKSAHRRIRGLISGFLIAGSLLPVPIAAQTDQQARPAVQIGQADDSLELDLSFDGESLVDRTGKHTVTLKGTAAFTEGKSGQAFLSEQGGSLQIDSSFGLGNEDFTVSFWFKNSDPKQQDTVLFGNKSGESGSDDGFFLCNYNGLYANYGIDGTRYDTSTNERDTTILDGDWHMVTVTADRDGALTLYCDGQISASSDDAAAFGSHSLDTAGLYTIGAGTEGGYAHAGCFDEFKVYSRVLGIQEIEEAYAKMVLPEPTLHMEFEQEELSDGTIMMDDSGQYTMTALGNVTSVPGVLGNAFAFDQGGRLVFDEALHLGSEDFTISFWYKAEEAKNDTVLFGNKSGESGSDAGFFLCNYNGLYANYGTGSDRYDSPSSASERDRTALDGNWHMITVSADRDGALSLYRDGRLTSSSEAGAVLEGFDLDTDALYTLGAGTEGGYGSKSCFDDFRMYTQALSADQVRALFASSLDVGRIFDEVFTTGEPMTVEVSMAASEQMKERAIRSAIKDRLAITEEAVTTLEASDEGWKAGLRIGEESASGAAKFTVQEKDVLTVASFNVYGPGWPDMAAYSRLLNANSVDVAGLQECNHALYSGNGQDEALIRAGHYLDYAYQAGSGSDIQWGGSTLVSKYPLSNKGGQVYTSNGYDNRCFVRSEIQIGDKTVAVYSTHIVWLTDLDEYTQKKQEEYEELIASVEADPTPYNLSSRFYTDRKLY